LRNIKIVFSYDGSLFFGSQSQSHKRTVQDELELALFRLTGEKARFTVAGRTDRGVHALAQAANFPTGSSIPADRFPKALNGKLGRGIVVHSASEVPLGFNSRKRAISREYLYFVYNGDRLPVMFRDRVLQVTKPLDLEKMSEAARLFTGQHDFVDYCAKGSSQNNYTRRVIKFEVGPAGSGLMKKLGLSGRLICFRIVANSFLYKMVRFIVGTLLEVGTGRIKVESVRRSLKGRSGGARCRVVPSCGLYLSRVKYRDKS
jgi:tRNA pseudouridine38-40 synthase